MVVIEKHATSSPRVTPLRSYFCGDISLMQLEKMLNRSCAALLKTMANISCKRGLTPGDSSHTLKLMDKRFDLKQFGQELWSREKARPIRSQLSDGLELMATGDVMVIDATGVQVFDFSFAEELFAKTVSTLKVEYPGRFLVVEGLTECARENLIQALEAKTLLMIERRKGKLNLLGKVHQADEATFAAIKSDGISAGELSRKLEVNLTAMNERLSKLANAGVIRREKGSSASGREQYVYKVLA